MRGRVGAATAALVLATPAMAETTKTFDVSARIVAGCVVASDAGGRWGTIDLGSATGAVASSVEATLISTVGGGIAIECTPGVTGSLSADTGDHPVAGGRNLQRAGGGTLIRYSLYANGASTPWTTTPLALTFAGGVRVIPIRAVATIAAATAAGTYTDTVRVTLTW